MNLFEQLVVWLIRNKQEVIISTGLVYGHKIVKIGNFQFTELSDKIISIDSSDFYTKVDNIDDLIRFVKGIK